MESFGERIKKRIFRKGWNDMVRKKKACLLEESGGLFLVREEFEVKAMGFLEKTKRPAEVIINETVYELYFICRTNDGRRMFIGIEKQEY